VGKGERGEGKEIGREGRREKKSEDDSLSSGEPLSWGERCHIKHLPTRKYLAVVQSGGEYKVYIVAQILVYLWGASVNFFMLHAGGQLV